MALYPDAIQKPITASKGRQRLTLHNRVNLHVAVSEAASLHGAFNQRGKPDSHFYVRRDGTVEQYVDTAWRANADLEGNDATISVETQGGVKNANSEPWTDAQVKALAALYAWAIETHGISKKIATDSKIGASSHGLSWHRLGVDGNFPSLPDITAGRNQRGGGMKYSKSRGKLCPGAGKIRQIPTIFAMATTGVEHVSKPTAPVVKPAPAPVKPGGYTGGSIVDYLASKGQASSFKARAALAKAHGVRPYVGTASQNTALLAKLRGGSTPTKPAPKSAGKTVTQMATEVIQGKHGNGHDRRRKSLGINDSVYQQVRAEVNRRAR